MKRGKLVMLRHQGKLLALLIAEGRLVSVKVYEAERASLLGNIYVGKIQSISPNISAAFVEIENREICFLPLDNVKNPYIVNGSKNKKLCAKDELLVQVVRDAVKTKQPVLTTQISLSGNYLAVFGEDSRLRMSSKLSEEKKRRITGFLLEQGIIDASLQFLPIQKESEEDPLGSPQIGAVIRTNTGNLTDLTPLLTEWKRLSGQFLELFALSGHRTCFSCLKKSNSPYLDDLKNYYNSDFEEIITDCPDIYEEITAFYQEQESIGGALSLKPAVRLYQDEYPLEKLYRVKTLLEDALSRRVWLKSGGYLVIEPTEALTVIDVNTGKCEAGRKSEDTFFSINMEAAEEIAAQLKLRNISGIIIVDFISMVSEEKQKELLHRLKILTAKDSVKTNIIDITPLGLVEITRKRVSRPLFELL